MKSLKSLSKLLLLAMLLLPAACFEDPKFEVAEIAVNPTALDFDKEAGEAVVKLVSNRDWTVDIESSDSDVSWLSLSDTLGAPSADSIEVAISVLPNNGVDRYATVYFRTETVYATVSVAQIGAIQKHYAPIDSVRSIYKGGNETIEGDNVLIRGTVVSNFRKSANGGLNNATSAKTLVVQDETAGISLYLVENNTSYALGDILEINVGGQELQRYNNGSLQVNNLPLENITFLRSSTVEAREITAAQLVSGDFESQYVAVPDVQVMASDMGRTFVEGDSHTSINFEAKTGEKFVLFSSQHSTFGGEAVPTGSGTLKGVAMVFGSTYQLSITSLSDYAGLTGERFDGTGGGGGTGDGKMIGDYNTWNSVGALASFLDDFSSITAAYKEYLNDNWLFWTSDGTSVNTGWKTSTYDNKQTGAVDRYIDIAPYSSTAEEVVAYALPPRVNVSAASPKQFKFSKALYYLDEDDGSRLEVVKSSDFAGDFSAATWDVVQDVSFPAGSEKNQWTDVVVDISSLSSETGICLALRYTGKGNTYRIDNVGWGDGQAAPYFSIDRTTASVPATAGTLNISVQSNVDWTAESSDNTNFRIDKTSGSGNGTVTVSYTENASESQTRSAVITFRTDDPSVSNNTLTCEITQRIVGSSERVFTSNVDITSNVNSNDYSYTYTVTTEGSDYQGLKIGSSSKPGTYTTPALPETGDMILSMFAVAWNNRPGPLTITVNGGGTINGSASATVDELVANPGTFNTTDGGTLEFTDSDYYTFKLSGITASSTLTFSTSAGNATRAVLVGVNVNK